MHSAHDVTGRTTVELAWHYKQTTVCLWTTPEGKLPTLHCTVIGLTRERFVALALPSWTHLRTRYWGVFILQGLKYFLRAVGLWYCESWGIGENEKVKTDSTTPGLPNLFTISYHLGTPYCQRVPLLPEKLILSNFSLFRRKYDLHEDNVKRPQLNLMKFVYLFTFHQLVDAWRKFANSASKVIMLRYNRNSRLKKNLFI